MTAERQRQAQLVIASLNLHGMKQGWRSRAGLVASELMRLDPDVMAIQEAARWAPQVRWLASRLARAKQGRYRAVTARKRGWRGLTEGLAVISRLGVVATEMLDLGGDARVAQRVRLEDDEGTRFDVYNVHLAHGGHRGELREAQVGRLLGAMGRQPSVPVVVAGDLNGTPDSRAVQLLASELRSAHELVHGQEPEFTAPSGPVAGAGWVLDYIFVSEGVRVLSCETAFRPVERGGRVLYPSDHLGLVATVAVGVTNGDR